jgi:hypothetical protein
MNSAMIKRYQLQLKPMKNRKEPLSRKKKEGDEGQRRGRKGVVE